MKLMKCENGHYFDADKTNNCPICAENVKQIQNHSTPEAMTYEEMIKASEELKQSAVEYKYEEKPDIHIGYKDPAEIKLNFICDCCRRKTKYSVFKFDGAEEIMDKYRKLAQEFVSLGYIAKVNFYCDDCNKNTNYFLPRIIFNFYAKWNGYSGHLSFPSSSYFLDDKYQYALRFLRGQHSYTALCQGDNSISIDYINKALKDIIGVDVLQDE